MNSCVTCRLNKSNNSSEGPIKELELPLLALLSVGIDAATERVVDDEVLECILFAATLVKAVTTDDDGDDGSFSSTNASAPRKKDDDLIIQYCILI